jgi:hypothetical protein
MEALKGYDGEDRLALNVELPNLSRGNDGVQASISVSIFRRCAVPRQAPHLVQPKICTCSTMTDPLRQCLFMT